MGRGDVNHMTISYIYFYFFVLTFSVSYIISLYFIALFAGIIFILRTITKMHRKTKFNSVKSYFVIRDYVLGFQENFYISITKF